MRHRHYEYGHITWYLADWRIGISLATSWSLYLGPLTITYFRRAHQLDRNDDPKLTR
jgi:hypothetical protein